MAALGIDIGGTFTDVVLMRDDGSISTTKTPTTPGRLLDGLMDGVAAIAEEEGVDVETLLFGLERIAHGTTQATNAYIERLGARVALLTTRGFEDTMIMQRMMGMTSGLTPSQLMDYSQRRVPNPLVPRSLIFGVQERVDYAGKIVAPINLDDVRNAAARIRESGVEAVAISYLWSFKNDAHEKRTMEILRDELPDAYLCCSCELVPRLGEYERTSTTVLNAYLGPLIRAYTDRLQQRFGDRSRVYLLDSCGGVMTPQEAGRAPVRLLLSGPSGGVTASRFVGSLCGHENILTFDMGGTSADVSLINSGKSLLREETEAGGFHLLLPMADVRTIGAGGGSIASVDSRGLLSVGPESAGAEPGPACYGRGGELPTVTDADVVLGIISPDEFLGGKMPLDRERAREAVRIHVAEPLGLSVEKAAAGIKRIIDSRMADLLRTVTIEQGHDPRNFVLYAFGGAGASHAPDFALDVVDEVVVPFSQSVFCAVGAVASDITLQAARTIPKRLNRQGHGDIDSSELDDIFSTLENRAGEVLADQGVAAGKQRMTRLVEVRFIRQTKSLTIPYEENIDGLLAGFLATYGQRYGNEAIPETAGFELVTYVVEARGVLSRPKPSRYPSAGGDATAAIKGSRDVYDLAGECFVDTPVYDGDRLKPGNKFVGPAIVEYPSTTVVVPANRYVRMDEWLNISIRRST